MPIRLKSVEQIVHAFSSLLNKLIFLLLDFVLPKFNKLNELFQSSSVIITNLHEKMCRNYQELLEAYMSRDYIHRTDLNDLDPCNKTHFLRPENMYFGVEVRKMLDMDHIRSALKLIANLNPPKAILRKTRDVMASLLPLMEALPRACIMLIGKQQIIDDEWRQLPFFQLPENIDVKDPIDSFWSKLMDCEGDQGMTFKHVSKFVLAVISLPHSNADSERIFSHINLIKTKSRNKISVSTVNGILLAKQRIKNKNAGCTTYEPSQSSRMNKTLMYKKNTASESTDQNIGDSYNDLDVWKNLIVF